MIPTNIQRLETNNIQIHDSPDIFVQFREVNRLIILGNGFDLAHGLKTSYKDFIYDYILQVLNLLQNNSKYEDDLWEISLSEYNSSIRSSIMERSVDKFLKLIATISPIESSKSIKWKSNFFRKIISKVWLEKWVDIEQTYFECLKTSAKLLNKSELSKLNVEFGQFSTFVTDYLSKINQQSEINPCDQLFDQFNEPIREKDCMPNTINKLMQSNSTCILNFNYTNTALKYLSKANNPKWSHIAIHGELEGDNLIKQKPILGYGDELNENYQSFETSPDDHFFTHMKSFKYLQFNNYRSLLEFIESNPFQVQLYGHSCGLSDRTLLNTIFENNNCISIKQFYHEWEGGDDYESKGYAISRHFRSKSSLRSKVVNKAYCVPMAQPVQVKEEKVSEK